MNQELEETAWARRADETSEVRLKARLIFVNDSRSATLTGYNSETEPKMMAHGIKRLLIHLNNLFLNESGQDLIEYALVVALIAFAATASMQVLATDISNAFSNISTSFDTSV
jgi:pilus assembly protein Flp/PilA